LQYCISNCGTVLAAGNNSRQRQKKVYLAAVKGVHFNYAQLKLRFVLSYSF